MTQELENLAVAERLRQLTLQPGHIRFDPIQRLKKRAGEGQRNVEQEACAGRRRRAGRLGGSARIKERGMLLHDYSRA